METNYWWEVEVNNRNFIGGIDYFKLPEDQEVDFEKCKANVYLSIDYDIQKNGIWCATVKIQKVRLITHYTISENGNHISTNHLEIDSRIPLNSVEWTVNNKIEFKPDGSYLIDRIEITLSDVDPIIELF